MGSSRIQCLGNGQWSSPPRCDPIRINPPVPSGCTFCLLMYHSFTDTRTHTHTYAHTHTHTHIHTHTHAHARTHTHRHTHTYTHARTRTHTRAHTRARARTHTHTHTLTWNVHCEPLYSILPYEIRHIAEFLLLSDWHLQRSGYFMIWWTCKTIRNTYVILWTFLLNKASWFYFLFVLSRLPGRSPLRSGICSGQLHQTRIKQL